MDTTADGLMALDEIKSMLRFGDATRKSTHRLQSPSLAQIAADSAAAMAQPVILRQG